MFFSKRARTGRGALLGASLLVLSASPLAVDGGVSGNDAKALGVVVRDQIPAGLTAGSATASVGAYDTAAGIWTIGALANGGSGVLTVVVVASNAGSFTNTASVSSNVNDPVATNNTSSAALAVIDVALPRTDGGNLGVLRWAAGLLVIGAVLVILARRRFRPQRPHGSGADGSNKGGSSQGCDGTLVAT